MPQILSSRTRALLSPLLSQVSGVLPVFLTGAVAVQLEDDLGLSASELGIVAASFFGAGALTSIPLGRLGDRIGPGRALRLSATTSGLAMLTAATLVRSWVALAAVLAIAGASAAASDPGANVYLARIVSARRLGTAFGMKQAAVPMATLVGGLAVPVIAIPFGWRWVYAAGATVALAAVVLSPRGDPRVGARPRGRREVPMSRLLILAVGFGAGSGAATTIGAFAVDAGSAAGLSNGAAGFAAALGSLGGLIARIGVGIGSDRRPGGHLGVAALMLSAGSGALLVLAVGTGPLFVAALPLAYATAGGWAGLVQLVVVRSNPGAPGAASGLVGTGAFVGCVIVPLMFGWLADAYGYGAAWTWSAVLAILAAVSLASLRHEIGGVPAAVVDAAVV